MYKSKQDFSKSEHIKKRELFARLFKHGRYFKVKDFSLRVIENNLCISRLGISIQSKVFGKAVDRNKIKRLIRDVFRRNKADLLKGYDVIVRPKFLHLINIGYNNIQEQLLELFKKAGIYKKR